MDWFIVSARAMVQSGNGEGLEWHHQFLCRFLFLGLRAESFRSVA